MTQKQQPKIEWGFYAVVPRVVRTQYKNLSHAEKWLYTCLKDLCGDKGTCFRTLRSLSEETDISIGSLSTMIPHLHEEGLIHAEKKKRSPKGKEVWHITIADIWQSNHEYCSKIEQATQDVHFLNKDVQKLNEPTPDRSEIEPHCSNFVDRRITHKNNNSEEYKDEEQESVNVSQSPTASPGGEDAHTRSSPSCSLCSEQEDIHPCQECGTRLCFEHRRDFPSETGSTHRMCVECLRQHNRAMVETPSANTSSVLALAPTAKAEPLIASATGTAEPAKEKAPRRQRSKKAALDLEAVAQLPKPARPDESMAWNAKKALLWADYFRGYTLPVSMSPRSDYKKAENAAIRLIQRGINERNFVAVLRYMRGLKMDLSQDEQFRADWWPDNQIADIWHVEQHYDKMAAEIKRKRLERNMLSVVGSSSKEEPEQKPEEGKPRPSVFIAGVGYQEPVMLPVHRPKPQPKLQGVAR